MMHTNKHFGAIALWASILGVLCPILINWFLGQVVSDQSFICGLSFVVFAYSQGAAVMCGFTARRTKLGKAALAISGVAITVLIALLLALAVFPISMRGGIYGF